MDKERLYQRWRDFFRDYVSENKEKLDLPLVYEHSLPAFFQTEMTIVENPDTLQPGLSRLEWLPDLPAGMQWPQDKGKALDFVAQVNLSDLEPGFHPSLPHRGWLYFFVGDFWEVNIIPHRVLYFDGSVSDLARARPPSDLQPPAQLLGETALVHFTPGFTIDPDLYNQVMINDGIPSEADPQVIIPFELPSHQLCQPEITRIGGYPYAFQSGRASWDALLYLSGFEHLVEYDYYYKQPPYRGDAKQDQNLRKKFKKVIDEGKWDSFTAEVNQYHQIKNDIDKHIKPVEILIGLESTMHRCWGDMGFLQFFIRQDDLAKHSFDQTYCEIIST